jgi:hypothetical protein
LTTLEQICKQSSISFAMTKHPLESSWDESFCEPPDGPPMNIGTADDVFCKIRFTLTPIDKAVTHVVEVMALLSTDCLKMMTRNEEENFKGFVAAGVLVGDAAKRLEVNEFVRSMTKIIDPTVDTICISKCNSVAEQEKIARDVADLGCLGLICGELHASGVTQFPLPVFRVLKSESISCVLEMNAWSNIKVEVAMAEHLPTEGGTIQETASHKEGLTDPLNTSGHGGGGKQFDEKQHFVGPSGSFPMMVETPTNSSNGRSNSFPDDEEPLVGLVVTAVHQHGNSVEVTLPQSANTEMVSFERAMLKWTDRILVGHSRPSFEGDVYRQILRRGRRTC